MAKKNTATQTPTAATAQPTIDLAALTPAQIAQLAKQLKEQKKADAGDHDQWVKVVDAMLHESDANGFKHTTSDILAACQAKAIIPMTISEDGRKAQIKRIQTRKQLLEKKPEHKGKVGYKVSSHSFGPLTKDKILDWFALPANVEALTPSEQAAIVKAMDWKG